MTSHVDEKAGFEGSAHSHEHPSQHDPEGNELGLKPTTTAVEGTTDLYVNGQLRCIPMPTADPKDPLNLPVWRKFMAIFALCCFGSIALAAQQILSSLLPVFVFEYAGLPAELLTGGGGIPAGAPPAEFPAGGIPPGGIPSGFPTDGFPPGGIPSGIPTGAIPSGLTIPTGSLTGIPSGFPTGSIPSGFSIPTGSFNGFPPGFTGIPAGATGPPPAKRADTPTPAVGAPPVGAAAGPPAATSTHINPNALAGLANIPGAPPLWRVNLLSSLPILLIGVTNYFLVPLSIVFGRRPIMLVCGVIVWVGCIWAGKTHSLNAHIAARCFMCLGAGAIESLVPLIVQDMSFIHQRNRAIGVVWASQAVVTISMGIGSTYIVSRMTWRWLYFFFAIFGAISWVLMIVFLPETRWKRTAKELKGESDECPAGEIRPPLNPEKYGPRTWRGDWVIYKGGVQWKEGGLAMKEIVLSLFFPNVFVIILLNSAFIGISLASSQTSAPVLLAPPYSWPFDNLGLIVIVIVIASIFVYLIGSDGSDRVANYLTKRRGGKREPEVHLYNLFFPLFVGILGCILFGIGGSYSDKVHWSAFVIGLGMLTFGFLVINIVGSVYAIECFPSWAGPVLVNVASFRNILGFAFTFGVTNWVEERGYIGCFGLFAGVIGFLSLGVPVLLIWGKRMRKSSGRFVQRHSSSD